MILTTTSIIEGKKIKEYKNIVTSEAIIGANVFRDLLAGITDVLGGRSGAYESALREAKNIAQKELIQQAKDVSANAVIGIDIDYETIKDGMLMVSMSGTAVVLQ